MEIFEFRAMNTRIVLAAEGSPERISAGFEQTQAYVQACEQRFTRFSEDSELAGLNRSAGTAFRASNELFDVVRQARSYLEQTGGLFDPSILPALEHAGYDRSMDLIKMDGGAPVKMQLSWEVLDFHAVALDPDTHEIWMPPGMRIDLGGIAKGWISEQAALQLASFSTACAVNAGGDMFLVGTPDGKDQGWQVELEDPRDPERVLTVLQVGPGAVATSSVTKRRWKQGRREQHHLIDPRKGEPAATEWLSVTVIAPHATTAEVFAKALLIAGPRDAAALAARRKDVAFIAVDHHGQLWGSPNSREYLYVESSK